MSRSLPAAPFAPDHPAAVATRACLLCRAPAEVLGVFVPGDPAEYGHARAVAYGLCRACFEGPDPLELIEAILLDSTKGAAA